MTSARSEAPARRRDTETAPFSTLRADAGLSVAPPRRGRDSRRTKRGDGGSGAQTVHPVILCGGAGSRLWPLSRLCHPKPLLRLEGARSLLQQTVSRVAARPVDARPGASPAFAAPLLLCQEAQHVAVAGELREIGISPHAIVLEPRARNTAPAAAAACHFLGASDPDALLLVLPADHRIDDVPAFRAAVARAIPAAQAGAIVTFGIPPTAPESGFGYIETGAPLAGAGGCRRVMRFIEKPDPDTAQAFCEQAFCEGALGKTGGFLWNSGIFLFRAARFLDELRRFHPGIHASCGAAVTGAEKAGPDSLRLAPAPFAAAEAISIDRAVMERTKEAAVLPVTFAWSDVGSWAALWEVGEKDENGNLLSGEVITRSVRNSYIRADKGLVAAIGLEDIVLVATGDAVLAAPRERAQEVRALVETLQAKGRPEALARPETPAPWGSHRTVDSGQGNSGPGFQVKHLVVNPGERLSLQAHRHRAEHWVVVSGEARIVLSGKTSALATNESVFIPRGAPHRLENPGTEPLVLIEVQVGNILSEDDIVRLADDYGRQ
jgi:mannose-1-phosphate guanylyltransferase/mannose-6-phosphate isomerase